MFSRRLLAVSLALGLTLGPIAPALAHDEAPAERPFVQFVERNSLFGLFPVERPIPFGSRFVSHYVVLRGGANAGQIWQISGHDNPILDSLEYHRWAVPGWDHPHDNLIKLFAPSQAASVQLHLADAAASFEDRCSAATLGLLAAGIASMGYARAGGEGTGNQALTWTGYGLLSSSLVSLLVGVMAQGQSVTHLSWAVQAWNVETEKMRRQARPELSPI